MARKKSENFVVSATRSAKDKIEEAKDSTENIIKKHPLTSVAIAAAVGAIVALGVNALTNRESKPLLRRFKNYFD